MARISERSPRFRSKDKICEEVAFILNAPLSWGTQFAVAAEALWVWSEFDGKYRGCTHWSNDAWRTRTSAKQLRHDHIVPRKLILAHLGAMRGEATAAKVREVLDKWCIGVVITQDEDRRLRELGLQAAMPADWDHNDPWTRYKVAGIELKPIANAPATQSSSKA